MNHQFVYDSNTKQHFVEVEGELAAVGYMLSTEFSQFPQDSTALQTLIHQLENSQDTIVLTEWHLSITEDEVLIKANNLSQVADPQNDSLEINVQDNNELASDNWDNSCHCAIDDLLYLLRSWSEFVNEG